MVHDKIVNRKCQEKWKCNIVTNKKTQCNVTWLTNAVFFSKQKGASTCLILVLRPHALSWCRTKFACSICWKRCSYTVTKTALLVWTKITRTPAQNTSCNVSVASMWHWCLVCNTSARNTAVSSVWHVSLLTNVPDYETQYFICVKHYVTSCDQNASTCWTTCSCPGHIIIISRLLKKLTNATIIQLKKKLRCAKELRMDGKIVLVRNSVSSCLCRLLEWYSHC